MTKKEDFYINFSGLAHDHTTHESCEPNTTNQVQDGENQCSVIAILRRHPMYDCLVLVKKYRACLSGYSLEFPVDKFAEQGEEEDSGSEATSDSGEHHRQPAQVHRSASSGALLSKCSRRKLISRLIDGDDPMFQYYLEGSPTLEQDKKPDGSDPTHPFSQQTDDKGQSCEFVHVPLNGLLHRLRHHTESGIAVDSRVYAFAMGLKFAERILTTNSMREIQETPI